MGCTSGFKFNISQNCFINLQQSLIPRQVTGNTWLDEDADSANNKVVSLGFHHSAAIKTDGTLWLWGLNDTGRLGDNTLIDRSSPVQTISGGTNWKQVNSGERHVAAIKTDGTLWLWGWGQNGRLGNNSLTDQSSPVQTVSGGNDWRQVDAQNHTAAIKTDGSLWLWGPASFGRLGINSIIQQSSPVQTISGGTNWKQVSTGRYQTAAVKTDGSLWLWGRGTAGRLGNNSEVDQSSPVQTVSGGTDWKQVSLGCTHSAAIKTDGSLWLWGSNIRGGLGTNSLTNQSSPVQTVSGGTNWKEVFANKFHYNTAAIKTDGTLWLWGASDAGALGTGFTIDQSSPVQTISGGTNWKQAALGCLHSAATKSDCTLYMWGLNTWGQLAQDRVLDYQISTKAVDFDDIFVRKEFFSEGGLWGWGSIQDGALGNNQSSNFGGCISSPVQTVAGGTNWKQVSSGCTHSAAIKSDGTLWSWGIGVGGRLGNNSAISRSSPVQTISAGTNWQQVSAGSDHSAAIKSDGSLWLWGINTDGKLGDNSVTSQSSPVQTVSGGTNWQQVSAGSSHSAAIKSDGTLWLWGCGASGRLGNNSVANQSSPVQTISGGTNWKYVDASSARIAAIKTDGTLWVWGSNTYGRLGTGDTIFYSSPVQTISGGTNWKQVSGCFYHSAAIKTDGTLWLWGCGTAGVLGNDSAMCHSSPVQTVSGGTNWKQVSVGGEHVAAIKTDGTLWVWGQGSSGRLGINSTIDQSSPVQTVSGGTNWKQVNLGLAHTFAIREDCW